MGGSRSEFFAALRRQAASDAHFFSDHGRALRERAVVEEMLKTLDVQHQPAELHEQPVDSDVDVAFRDARFQVTELLGGRRRGDEVRERVRRWLRARTVADIEEDVERSAPLSFAELVEAVADGTRKKTARTATRRSLDLLVYVDLRGRHLRPARWDDLVSVPQGWRSLTILIPPYGLVLYASGSAPAFLREKRRSVVCRPGVPWQ